MSQSQAWWEPPASPPPPEGQDLDLKSHKMDIGNLPDDSAEELLTRRIHVLGTGSIGTLVAHSLAILPNPPPVTILLHRPQLYEDFKAGKRIVRLVNKHTEVNDEQTGFDVDVARRNDQGQTFWQYYPHNKNAPKTPVEPLNPLNDGEKMDTGEVFIYTLIVSVKGPATVGAIRSVKHRVDARTTILLMQNGMGQIDALNKEVFPDPKTRPTYMLGIITHGCYMQGPFAVVHAGFGTVALGVNRDFDKNPLPPKDNEKSTADLSEADRKAMYPSDADLYSNLSARYLLRTLTRSPVLACAAYPYLDLLQLQLEKLVSNCTINPLTALFDVENGLLLTNEPTARVVRLLIAEISLVIRNLPELEGVPNAKMRFSPARLEAWHNEMTNIAAKNSSSMREDMRHVRATEIDFINGYIVKRGEELGIKCILNYMVMQQIKAKFAFLLGAGSSSIPSGLSTQTSEKQGDAVVLEEVEGRRAEAESKS